MSVQDKSSDPEEFIIPAGIEIKQIYGSVTRQPLFKVDGFEMPYMSSPEDAVRVYQSLKHAYETGYFNGSSVKKSAATKATSPEAHNAPI